MPSGGHAMAELMKEIIERGEITTSEYEKIIHLADEDSYIDPHEQQLLAELLDMIEHKTLKRVPG